MCIKRKLNENNIHTKRKISKKMSLQNRNASHLPGANKSDARPSPIEKIKTDSKGLRGSIIESLSDEITGAVREQDHALIKFHGMYEQDDRDLREERAAKKLDKLYSFMIRLRIPGGLISPQQWVAAHHIAGAYSTKVIKITTRQTIQLHGILKRHIKPTLKDFDAVKLDSIAACGDVNRNVMCSAHPAQTPLHKLIHDYADKISQELLPQTKAYYEIWLDEEIVLDKKEDDPLYQDRYLPRKFKIAIAIPPNNDVDVFANDLGLIAIIENGDLIGFNIAVGGGLSATHGNPETYARLASVIGFVDKGDNLMKAVYEVLTVQRDFGNRSDRKLARLKYTIDKLGIAGFKKELESRCGFKLADAKTYEFTERKDYYGWLQNAERKWYYTAFVENGRVLDDEQAFLKTALLKVAETGFANFRFTANQNVIIADVHEKDKAVIEDILNSFGVISNTQRAGAVRRNAIACVSFNTCPLALAEAQRYLPMLITKLEPLLTKHNISDEEISVRMTGCPNGCGRSPLAEIGFIGTAYGMYNMHLGGDRLGERLNIKYKENLHEDEILHELDRLFSSYSRDRLKNETFGDYVIRKKIVSV